MSDQTERRDRYAERLTQHRVECVMVAEHSFGWQCLTCKAEGWAWSSLEAAEQASLGHHADAVLALADAEMAPVVARAVKAEAERERLHPETCLIGGCGKPQATYGPCQEHHEEAIAEEERREAARDETQRLCTSWMASGNTSAELLASELARREYAEARAESAEAALVSLRGRVEGLAEEWESGIPCDCGHGLDTHNGLGCYERLSYEPLVKCSCVLTDSRHDGQLAAVILRAVLAAEPTPPGEKGHGCGRGLTTEDHVCAYDSDGDPIIWSGSGQPPTPPAAPQAEGARPESECQKEVQRLRTRLADPWDLEGNAAALAWRAKAESAEADRHDERCESEFIPEAGAWTSCDCESRARGVAGIVTPGGITPGGMPICPDCGRWGSNPGGLCVNGFHDAAAPAPQVEGGEE